MFDAGLQIQLFGLDERVSFLEQNGGGSSDNSSLVELETRVSALETETANQAEDINSNTQIIKGCFCHLVSCLISLQAMMLLFEKVGHFTVFG